MDEQLIRETIDALEERFRQLDEQGRERNKANENIISELNEQLVLMNADLIKSEESAKRLQLQLDKQSSEHSRLQREMAQEAKLNVLQLQQLQEEVAYCHALIKQQSNFISSSQLLHSKSINLLLNASWRD